MKKNRYIGCWILSITCLIPILLILIPSIKSYNENRKLVNNYRNTIPGDCIDNMEKRFDQKPNFVVSFNSCKIVYFILSSGAKYIFLPKKEHNVPASVNCPDEIPDIYDSIQALVDSNGKILAITWCGETYFVRTIWGDIPGSNVKVL